jgi:hypothetical protein
MAPPGRVGHAARGQFLVRNSSDGVLPPAPHSLNSFEGQTGSLRTSSVTEQTIFCAGWKFGTGRQETAADLPLGPGILLGSPQGSKGKDNLRYSTGRVSGLGRMTGPVKFWGRELPSQVSLKAGANIY